MSTLWGREPAMLIGLVNASLALATSFGLHMTTDQVGAIAAVTAALAAFITRSQVYAPATVANMKDSRPAS